MEILAILAFSGVLFALLESIKPAAPKSAEQELGDAIAKYLSQGVKGRSEKD
ncbi:MAG: hypothetical protein IGS48_19025 [Oscillatoriales cyanobacterium C42_A2020_001]|nr:hypothetical protein [Leptolyngbyaceae cyanobacterium C42_A2020_001]